MKIWQDDSFIFISIRKELYEWSSEGEKKLFLAHFHRFCEPRRQHIISEHANEENMWGGASAWGVETRQNIRGYFVLQNRETEIIYKKAVLLTFEFGFRIGAGL